MLTILFDNQKPIYIQIYEFIKNEIRSGSIAAHSPLPSRRKLASHLAVSLNTVDSAYAQLIAEGYIQAKPKRGYFVCELDEYVHTPPKKVQIVPPQQTNTTVKIDFSPSDVDNTLFPFEPLKKIFKTTFSRDDLSILKRPNPQGEPSLRLALTDFLKRSRGVLCDSEQIIIGSGTDHLLQILSHIFGEEKTIICENPVYLKAYKIFKNLNHLVVPVDIDEKGIRTSELTPFSSVAIYITPSHHFPLGISMPIDRRLRLLNFTNTHSENYIIEDDYDSEFRYNEKPIPSLHSIDKGGRVIYIGTFSMSISPSIRVSYMVLPKSLLTRYKQVLPDLTLNVSALEQRMIAEFIVGGGFEVHINKMRKHYKEKRSFFMEKLRPLKEHIDVLGEDAGHHLLMRLKTGLSEREMCEKALKMGIKLYPISPYFLNGVTREYGSVVLAGYSALTLSQIDEGVELIKKAWELDIY